MAKTAAAQSRKTTKRKATKAKQTTKPESTEKTKNTEARGKGRPFEPGQSGNPAGRPKGARSRLAESFLKALADDFDVNGVAAIQTVRLADPSTYVRICAAILPKDVNVKVSALDEMSDDQIKARIAQLAGALGGVLGVRSDARAGGTARRTETPR